MKVHAKYSVIPIDCLAEQGGQEAPPAGKIKQKDGDDDDMTCRYNETLQREILNELRNFNAMMKDLQDKDVGTPRKGLEGLVKNQELIYNQTGERDVVIPESWMIRSDAVRHLVVRWRQIQSDGRLGKHYSTTVVPYYRHNDRFTPKLTDRRLGSKCSTLSNIGAGANLVVFGVNHTVSDQALKELAELVEPSRLPADYQKLISHHTHPTNFTNDVYRATDIFFFPEGWKHGTSLKEAKWRKRIYDQ